MSEKETACTPAPAVVAAPIATEEVPPSGPVASLSWVRAGTGDPAMTELLELFDGPLREIVFPDVSRDTLHALAAETAEAMSQREARAAALTEAEEVLALAEAAVAGARAALREAEASVDERHRTMLARGQRALSYAKVFAESDPDLHARLSGISLARIAQRGRSVSAVGGKGAAGASARDARHGDEAAPRKRGRPRRVIDAAVEPVDASVSS